MLGAVQLLGQVGAAPGAVNPLLDAEKHLLDLAVQIGTVGDDQHPRAGDVFQNPLGQPHHGQRLAAALGMPEDAALAAAEEGLRGLHPEILVLAAQLLDAGIEHHEVVDQLQQPRFFAHLQQLAVQQVGLLRHRPAVLNPAPPILLRRLDSGVAQALAIIARHQPLLGGEEGLDECLLLIVQMLADALGHRDGGAFQLQHAQRDAVDVDHQVRALGAGLGRIGQIDPLHRHLLGNGEVIVLRMLPVDQPDGVPVLARAGLDLYAVAQQVIDVLVAVVKALAGVRRHLDQLMQRPVDEGVADALPGEPTA